MAMNTEGSDVVDYLSRIPPTVVAICLCFMITSLNIIGINIADLFVFLAFDWNGW